MDQDIPGISLEFPEGSLPSDVGLSDVLEVIEETDPSFAQLQQQPSQQQRQGTLQEAGAAVGIMISGGSMQTRTMPPSQSGPITLDGQPAPWLEIVEQPAGKALRFRYECEGRSAGSIPGTSSTPENKTFPTVRINNYNGRVLVVVSCVTKDAPHRPHPHNLVGKEVCANGICRVEVPKETMTVSFDKLGIQCVKRREIEKSLKLREKQKIDPFGTGYEHMRQPTSIDLNSVRLCFHAWIEGRDHKFRIPLKPVVSDPIYDKKAMSDLMICKLSHCSASVAGGQAMILLCEKVAKDDIEVRFFEERDGYVVWEGKGEFQPTQVHKQVAISLLTPPYRSNHVTSPVNVFIQLRRPSDGATSEALPFTMTPLTPDDPDYETMRRRKIPKMLEHVQAVARKHPDILKQVNYNLNFNIKPEPTDRVSPFQQAGSSGIASSPAQMYQLESANINPANMLQPISTSPGRVSPMYNFGDPNNPHGELQPLLNMNESSSNMNEPMQIHTLGGYQQTNDLTNQSTNIIADAINISNALNIYDGAQQQNVNLPVLEAVDANMSNLSITDINVSADGWGQDVLNELGTSNNSVGNSGTDSFTTKVNKAMTELGAFAEQFNATREGTLQ